ncbi:hypothetical protein TNCV_3077221 [Trichonephila clavipes]|nr:hypothetical protein TNCV_3077221 [Trichonephila clavipes]
MSRLKRPPISVVWKLEEGVPAQVSSTSLDHGSKLRDPSPKALEYLNSATLKFTQSLPSSLVVRALDSRPEGLGSMPDAPKYPPSAHGDRAR